MGKDVDIIYSKLLSQDYALTLFGKYGTPQKDSSSTRYKMLCPLHSEKTPSFKFNLDKPRWKCFGCDKGGDWINFLEEKEGLSFQDALAFLAKEAGVTLSGTFTEEDRLKRDQSEVLERALPFFQEEIFKPEGKEALDYLIGRGYTKDEIERMELGFYPSQEALKVYLVNKGYSVNNIRDAGLFTKGFGETHKLVIPYRSPLGEAKGVIARNFLSGESKYINASGVKIDTLFNLHHARKEERIIIVEGSLDALICEDRGVKGVVAICGNHIKEGQIESLKKQRHVKRIVLALDSDNSGIQGTEELLNLLQQEGFQVYVLEGISTEDKDPDGYIKKHGLEAFKKLLDKAPKGVKWKVNSILSKHSLQTDQDIQEAVDEAIAYDEVLNSLDSFYLVETLASKLKKPIEALEPMFKSNKEKKQKEKLVIEYKDFLKECEKLVSMGKTQELKDFLEEKTREFKSKTAIQVKPYTLESLTEDIQKTKEGLKTGYSSLDALIRIPQEAITIVAGKPSHGKTTLLLNLCLNMTRIYTDRSFFFFSYEVTKKQIGLNFLKMLSEEVIVSRLNDAYFSAYIKGNNTDRPRIEKAKKEYKELVDSKRLWVINEHFFVNELTDTLAFIKDNYNVGAVFIDYIQKIGIKGKYQTRQLEVQKISDAILTSAINLSIPIILGAQVNRSCEGEPKLDSMREAGDIEQDANVVLGLYNQAREEADEAGSNIGEDTIKLKVTTLKNRSGVCNESVCLDFNRPMLKITDPVEESRG